MRGRVCITFSVVNECMWTLWWAKQINMLHVQIDHVGRTLLALFCSRFLLPFLGTVALWIDLERGLESKRQLVAVPAISTLVCEYALAVKCHSRKLRRQKELRYRWKCLSGRYHKHTVMSTVEDTCWTCLCCLSHTSILLYCLAGDL
jgi:alkylhydroperoxidase family enzyme